MKISIFGLGYVGAVSLACLARDGHTVALIERAPVVEPIGAGVLLQCSGQEVLSHLGLLDHVLAHAAPIDELYARHSNGVRAFIANSSRLIRKTFGRSRTSRLD